jgi:aryl-alcohol dehydrogenase-like predicted oxidoreductase
MRTIPEISKPSVDDADPVTFPVNLLPDGKPISAFGFGCSSYWSKHSFLEEDAVKLVLRACQLGINHFDTGPSYGWGEAERRLGLALKSLDRNALVVSTKVGTFRDAGGKTFKSFEPSRLRGSVESSLARLGLDQIDILYLHGPQIQDLSPALIDCLTDLKGKKLVRFHGINTFDRPVLKRAAQLPFDVVMTQYNVFDVSRRDDIELLKLGGKTIIGGTALGQGIFNYSTLIPRSKKSLWYLLRALKNDPVFPLTRWRARQRISKLGCPPLQAALLLLLQTPAITSSVFGTTTMAHLEQNVDAIRNIRRRCRAIGSSGR